MPFCVWVFLFGLCVMCCLLVASSLNNVCVIVVLLVLLCASVLLCYFVLLFVCVRFALLFYEYFVACDVLVCVELCPLLYFFELYLSMCMFVLNSYLFIMCLPFWGVCVLCVV